MCPLIRTLKTSLSVHHCVQHNPRKAARCETKINNVVSRSYIPVRGVICDSKYMRCPGSGNGLPSAYLTACVRTTTFTETGIWYKYLSRRFIWCLTQLSTIALTFQLFCSLYSTNFSKFTKIRPFLFRPTCPRSTCNSETTASRFIGLWNANPDSITIKLTSQYFETLKVSVSAKRLTHSWVGSVRRFRHSETVLRGRRSRVG